MEVDKTIHTVTRTVPHLLEHEADTNSRSLFALTGRKHSAVVPTVGRDSKGEARVRACLSFDKAIGNAVQHDLMLNTGDPPEKER